VTVRAIVKHPGKPAEVVQIGRTLADLQKLVGGFAEVGVKAPIPLDRRHELLVYVNDEGAINGMAPNVRRPTDGWPLCGPIVLVKSKPGDGYPVDMTEAEAAGALSMLSSWRAA
jgi:hypothetical protein